MQKLIKISCCAECPNYTLHFGHIPHCFTNNRRIDEDSESFVNLGLVKFPEWCPLETVGENSFIDFKNEIKQIIQIVGDNTDPDSIVEASYYLNTVFEKAKK